MAVAGLRAQSIESARGKNGSKLLRNDESLAQTPPFGHKPLLKWGFTRSLSGEVCCYRLSRQEMFRAA